MLESRPMLGTSTSACGCILAGRVELTLDLPSEGNPAFTAMLVQNALPRRIRSFIELMESRREDGALAIAKLCMFAKSQGEPTALH